MTISEWLAICAHAQASVPFLRERKKNVQGGKANEVADIVINLIFTADRINR